MHTRSPVPVSPVPRAPRAPHTSRPHALAAIAFALGAAACASDLKATSSARDGGGDGQPAMGVVTTRVIGEQRETLIDASWDRQWVHYDFEQSARVEVADPANERGWDLGFQRFRVKSNGGVTGKAGVEVALVPDVALTDLTHAPAIGWLVDQEDGDDGNLDADFVFNQGTTWFAYDVNTHVLAARKAVYVVLTDQGNYVGVQILKYYDDAGTAGFVLFRWKPLLPPLEARVSAPPPTRGAGAGGDAGSEGENLPDAVAKAD